MLNIVLLFYIERLLPNHKMNRKVKTLSTFCAILLAALAMYGADCEPNETVLGGDIFPWTLPRIQARVMKLPLEPLKHKE